MACCSQFTKPMQARLGAHAVAAHNHIQRLTALPCI